MSTIANSISSAVQTIASSSVLGSEHFDVNSITPDALLIYLNGRMGSVDGQMSTIFDRQKNAEKVRSQLRALEETLTGMATSKDEGANVHLPQETYNKIDLCIRNISEVDPKLADKIRADLSSDCQVLGGDLSDYTTTHLNNSKEYLNMVGKDLESGAQMDMITLQSLMGARQTAIQLSTNLISALNESQKSIVGNIR